MTGGEERVLMMKGGGLDGFLKKQQKVGRVIGVGHVASSVLFSQFLRTGLPNVYQGLYGSSRPATMASRLSALVIQEEPPLHPQRVSGLTVAKDDDPRNGDPPATHGTKQESAAISNIPYLTF